MTISPASFLVIVNPDPAFQLLTQRNVVFTGVEATGDEASFVDSYGNITVCGPEAAALASYLTQHSLWAFLSPTVRGRTVVYEQRSEALGQQGLALLANRLSDELACAVFAVQNVENEIFWYKLYVGGLLIDEYTAACNPYRPGDAGALCAALGVAHQVAAVADILAAWCWSVSRYERTAARHQDLVNALDLPIYSVGVGYRLLSGGNVPRQISLGDFRRVAPE